MGVRPGHRGFLPVPLAGRPRVGRVVRLRGGVFLALLLLAGVAIAAPEYRRQEWMSGWADEDGDCQTTRTEVLIRDARAVSFQSPRSGADCEVAAGVWRDPYTGEQVTDPSTLDVDHLVPIAEAHRSGGHAWSAERKKAYANDLTYRWHLIATTAHANRSKGDRAPQDWKPPASEVWCEYATAWAVIKFTWNLSSTADRSEGHGQHLSVASSNPGRTSSWRV
jgi:uncharacterized protein DUF1524